MNTMKITERGGLRSQKNSMIKWFLSGILKVSRHLTYKSRLSASTITKATSGGTLYSPRILNNVLTPGKPRGFFGTGNIGAQNLGRSRFPNFLRVRLLACYAGVLRLKQSLQGNTTTIPVFDLVNAGPRHRFLTAQFLVSNCLALGYGAGFEKFVQMAALYTGLDLTANDPEWLDVEKTVPGWGKRAKEIVSDFRARNPKIVGLWNQLDLALKRSVADNLRVALPSGRVLSYEQVKCERRLKPDRVTGKPKLSAVFTADVGRRFEYYGGKLCENLVQATARDVMADGMLRVEAAGHVVLWSVHDELIIECAPGTDPKEISDLMSVAPAWMPGIPLAAEAREVPRYCK